MPDRVVLLTIPGLVAGDVSHMPNLRSCMAGGDRAALAPSCPCTDGPLRANMATGATCGQHGIVADRLYIRQRQAIEADPAWSDYLEAPAIWQILQEHQPEATSAVCFVPGSHACGAAATCNLAPGSAEVRIHPAPLAAELSWPAPPPSHDPLWAAQFLSGLVQKARPDFLWCEFPRIAEAAEIDGPGGPQVADARWAIDVALGRLFPAVEHHYGSPPLWLVVSPCAISATSHVLYPNQLLRQAGLLKLASGTEHEPDLRASRAWALTDRQISHVYVTEGEPSLAAEVGQIFAGEKGVAEVLVGAERSKYDLLHERAGDVIVISQADSRQSRRLSDAPVTTVRGSHGAPATDDRQRGVILASERGVLSGGLLLDTDICDLVLRQFGI